MTDDYSEILAACREKYDSLTEKLKDPSLLADPRKMAEVGREHARLESLLEKLTRLETIKKQRKENAAIIGGDDPELVDLAVEENAALAEEEQKLREEVAQALLPPDPDDRSDVILEIRAGAGGEESALFAAELFRMYTRFAEKQGWKTTVLSRHRTDMGGLKEVIAEVSSADAQNPVYAGLKYESGVHRVQRVPETEKQGRVHTSTATVAVLPRAESEEVEIDPKDLRVDTFASSGPGGQSVNTTMSAVRLTHLPTGLMVSCQDEKSQHKNKERALSVLRARLKRLREEEEARKIGQKRKSQIGTGDRSEKIRTYNIPQDRLTEHRLKRNWSNVRGILDGDLDEIVEALREEDARSRRAEMENPF